MKAVAIKKGQSQEQAAGFREMAPCGVMVVVRSSSLGHQPASADKKIAEKQAHWLEKVLAEEHERE